VSLSLHDGALEAQVGPVDVVRELERELDDEELSLRRVLSAVVDDVAVDGDWVRLRKRVEAHV
jgi:hypothetical protein